MGSKFTIQHGRSSHTQHPGSMRRLVRRRAAERGLVDVWLQQMMTTVDSRLHWQVTHKGWRTLVVKRLVESLWWTQDEEVEKDENSSRRFPSKNYGWSLKSWSVQCSIKDKMLPAVCGSLSERLETSKNGRLACIILYTRTYIGRQVCSLLVLAIYLNWEKTGVDRRTL